MNSEGQSADDVLVNVLSGFWVECWGCDEEGVLIGVASTYDEAMTLRGTHIASAHNDGQDA